MNSLIIFKSIHQQNTKKIAQKIGETLNAEIVNIDELPQNLDLKNYDLIGLGSGIYAFKHHVMTFLR